MSSLFDTDTPSFTEVFFHHKKGGSIYKHSKLSAGPILSAKEASPFRIIPLDTKTNKPLLADCCETISSKSDYYDLLRSEQWSKVAIQNEDGLYLSCPKLQVFGRTETEYRNEIGDFEKFTVEPNTATNTFSFKSHNDLFLHYNHYIQTIAFKEREKDAASWIVSPCRLCGRLNDLIRFVGVVTSEGDFLMQKNYAQGSKPAWQSDVIFKGVVKELSEKMIVSSIIDNRKGVGCCTIFKDQDAENIWFVTKTKEGELNVIIASFDCPVYIGVYFVEEIEAIFAKHHAMEREKLLNALLITIVNRYEFSVNGIIKDEIKKDCDKMNIHLVELQKNKEHAQDLVLRGEELKVLGRNLYQRLFELPGNKWSKGAKKTPDMLAKGVSKLACSFAGSKLGNNILGDKAEVVVDATLNSEMETNGPIYKFWTKRFISFGINFGEVEIDLTSEKMKTTEEIRKIQTINVVYPPELEYGNNQQDEGVLTSVPPIPSFMPAPPVPPEELDTSSVSLIPSFMPAPSAPPEELLTT